MRRRVLTSSIYCDSNRHQNPGECRKRSRTTAHLPLLLEDIEVKELLLIPVRILNNVLKKCLSLVVIRGFQFQQRTSVFEAVDWKDERRLGIYS